MNINDDAMERMPYGPTWVHADDHNVSNYVVLVLKKHLEQICCGTKRIYIYMKINLHINTVYAFGSTARAVSARLFSIYEKGTGMRSIESTSRKLQAEPSKSFRRWESGGLEAWTEFS
jgi:hypothetical protein